MRSYVVSLPIAVLLSILLATAPLAQTVQDATPGLNLNQPERLAWLQDAGFGMFIHFSFDSQLGVVISHSMVGASEDYLNRYINELPKTFNPQEFAPRQIATLAKLAGMRYIVLTAKHHSGFCLWDTKTTNFKITSTPYQQDLLTEYAEAVRAAGLAVGLYFSPEDFLFLHEHDQVVSRDLSRPLPPAVMDAYLEMTRVQMSELMTNYGPIDVLFLDSEPGPLMEQAKRTAWETQPDLLITRGAIATPEQSIPGQAFDQVWEACMTMGTQWQYKPTNEVYKSGTELIEILIESRAKGGTLLLNVGPTPRGTLPEAQEAILREVAAWNFINQEAIREVRPWITTHEEDIWFTRHKNDSTVYAYLTKQADWPRGERREFVLRSVQITDSSQVSVLGQSDQVVEYQPDTDATTRYEQQSDGLRIGCVRAQRIYNNHRWPNPLVLKITHARATPDLPR